MSAQHVAARPVSYFPVSPVMLFPETLGEFCVYLWRGGDFVLYAQSGRPFTRERRQALLAGGVREVYVRSADKPLYDGYVERHLGRILNDESLPIEVRSKVFIEASTAVMQDAFDRKLPASLRARHFNHVTDVVKSSIKFLASDDSLSAIAPFVSHDYKTYTHCLHVFIYCVTIFRSFDMSESEIFECALGALLHDVGKTRIPARIINKRGPLTKAEYEVVKEHPLHGVSMCAHLPMTQNAVNCILFHHEKIDGSGYPAGLTGDSIPLPVRVITLADVYDALTSHRPYAEAMAPYEALTLIRNEMRDGVDMRLFRRFVAMLSGADML